MNKVIVGSPAKKRQFGATLVILVNSNRFKPKRNWLGNL